MQRAHQERETNRNERRGSWRRHAHKVIGANTGRSNGNLLLAILAKLCHHDDDAADNQEQQSETRTYGHVASPVARKVKVGRAPATRSFHVWGTRKEDGKARKVVGPAAHVSDLLGLVLVQTRVFALPLALALSKESKTKIILVLFLARFLLILAVLLIWMRVLDADLCQKAPGRERNLEGDVDDT